MELITVRLPDITYNIKIEHGILERIGKEIKSIFQEGQIFIITDSNVAELYLENVENSLKSEGFKLFSYVVCAGEESKNFQELQKIYSFLINNGASRKDLLIALGGGVIGDMSGFAAATYMRGMKFAQIPTTLLAQIDSSIGGKVAVNLPEGKNLAGTFFHPLIVLIDPECLRTLPPKILSDGAAEVLKNGYIRDPEIYSIFRKLNCINDIFQNIDEIIYRSCDLKRKVVENDEKESGERMILNFGHTLGHAYESYYNYKKYTHGEAVAIGMYQICSICAKMGLINTSLTDELRNILCCLNLPFEDKEADKELIIKNVLKDKKSNSKYTNIVLLKEIGNVSIEKIPSEEIREFFIKGGFLS